VTADHGPRSHVLAGRLTGWLAGPPACWLSGWLQAAAGRRASFNLTMLDGWLAGRLAGPLAGWLVGGWLAGWLADWLSGRLAG